MAVSLGAARSVLTRQFGYADFRPGQEAVVAAVLTGRDALAVMPTGAGKSVCYQVPAVVLDGLTVVVGLEGGRQSRGLSQLHAHAGPAGRGARPGSGRGL